MTVSDILGVWNLFMTRQFIPVYTMVYITAPCLKLPALLEGPELVDSQPPKFAWGPWKFTWWGAAAVGTG